MDNETRHCRKPSCRGFTGKQIAKDDLSPTSQDAIVTEIPTEPERPDRVSTEDAKVSLLVKTESEAVITRGRATVRGGKV